MSMVLAFNRWSMDGIAVEDPGLQRYVTLDPKIVPRTGARYPKAVECSPQRRVDQALKYFVQGAYQRSFNRKKPIEQALAEEILGAYGLSTSSMAIAKKFEIERQSDSSR